MSNAILTQDRLKELFHYAPETGVFTRLVAAGRRVRVGSVAGTVGDRGYVQIMVDLKLYKAHRLAWLYVHGNFPSDQLDHINRDRADNKLSNLRLATNAENGQNRSMSSRNTSGHVGVHWYKRTQQWMAYITFNRQQINLGYFADLDDAIAARKVAELQFHTWAFAS